MNHRTIEISSFQKPKRANPMAKTSFALSFVIFVLLVMPQPGISQEKPSVMEQSTTLEQSRTSTYPVGEGERTRLLGDGVYILGNSVETRLHCYCTNRAGRCSIAVEERLVVCAEGPGEACAGRCKFIKVK